MEKFEFDCFEEYEKYGEEYEEIFDEEFDSLREEIEDLDEILEEKEREYSENFDQAEEKTDISLSAKMKNFEEISQLDQRKRDLESMEREMLDQKNEVRMIDQIEKDIRPKSEYWADRYTRMLKEVIQDIQKEDKERQKCEEFGKDYFGPYPSATLRKQFLDTKIELAASGMTPDGLSELISDYDGMLEGGEKYFETKDKLLKLLGAVSFEEADKLLETGREEGKYTDDNYWALKAMIRKHYGK